MLHFPPDVFARRQAALQKELEAANIDALLIFKQESSYYLTGFDTFGYVFFQCLIIDNQGTVALLTRSADIESAARTSTIEDVNVWVDGADANPVEDLHQLLRDRGLVGKRLGVEYDAYGLQGTRIMQLHAMLSAVSDNVHDCSLLVSKMRFVKDEHEIVFVREAAKIADAMLESAKQTAGAGAREADILAEMMATKFRMGGDFSANEPIIGSGDHALMVRYHSGRRVLDARDQLTLEFAGVYRHYHACLIRTLLIGPPTAAHIQCHKVATEALMCATEAAVPGATMGEVYEAHAGAFRRNGMESAMLNACGYSLGATFSPTWMDWTMLYRNNPAVLQPGCVIFLHMILQDREKQIALMPGHTVLVTEGGNEVLSQAGTSMDDHLIG